jgi:predicted RNase H-like HicB family nuclease
MPNAGSQGIINLFARERIMNAEYTAIVKQDGDWWIGWIEEIAGVNCQEHTREELMESLRATLKEALEFNRQDALSAVGMGYIEEKIAI